MQYRYLHMCMPYMYSQRCTAITNVVPPPPREYTPVLMALKHLANGAYPESLGVQLRNLPYILGVGGATWVARVLHLYFSHFIGG